MNYLSKAVMVAVTQHHGQFRKGDNKVPYIIHPMHVAGLLYEYGHTDEELLAAAILHDVLEDTESTEEELEELGFSIRIIDIVKALTLPNGNYRKFRESRIIKMADRLSNLKSMSGTDWSQKRMQKYVYSAMAIAQAGKEDCSKLYWKLMEEAKSWLDNLD